MPLTEREEVVLEDLRFLQQVWRKRNVTTADLRRTSVVLRLLLIDGGGILPPVARVRNIKIMVECPINTITISKWKGVVDLYICGNTEVSGINMSTLVMNRGSKPPDLPADETPEKRQLLSLGEFKKQICAMWTGVTVTREELIKYVLNKLGGCRYDERREGSPSLKFIALDTIRKRTKIAHLDGVYFELLATGRFLTESETINNLMSILDLDGPYDR